MVLWRVGWDKKEFLESNLHVYGEDDTKIIIYNMERWLKGKTLEKHQREKTVWNNPLNTSNRVHQQDIITSSSSRVEDHFFLSYLCSMLLILQLLWFLFWNRISYFTHSLQIHYLGLVGLKSNPILGPTQNRSLQNYFAYIYIYESR